MSNGVKILLYFCLVVSIPAYAQPLSRATGSFKVDPSVSFKAEPFPLSDIRILDGPFQKAQDLDVTYMLSLDSDRLLHHFYEQAGLQPKAPVYGGWESTELAGHTLGHYLSALALYYSHSRDERFKSRIDYLVDELVRIQQAGGTGYVGGIPESKRLWGEIAQGKITEAAGFSLNGIWSPWYTLHKLYAGLLDVYWYTGNEKALSVAVGMADWAYDVTKSLTPAQWQHMMDTEYGGMSEVLADLYGITGEQKYLDLSFKFHHMKVLGPLARRQPRLEGVHSNTQIPKAIGSIRQYEYTGSDSLLTIGQYFWEQVIEDHTYVTGGNTQDEYFGPPKKLANRLKSSTTETCNTYNMLKLTRHLFSLTGSPRYADYYERALFNHILASQEPTKGMMTYLTSLKPGHFKTYSSPEGAFWCCVGTGMENHVRYGEAVYFHHASDLFVNLFIASELEWKEKGLSLRQETEFPFKGSTRFVVASAETPVDFTLLLRHPGWAQGKMSVKVNGEDLQDDSTPSSYLALKRTWKTGDVVEVSFPMTLHLEPMPDNQNRIALLYGPIVLAGALGTDHMPAGGAFADDNLQYAGDIVPPVPVLKLNPENLEQSIQPVENRPLEFRTRGAGFPRDITLLPFFLMNHQRYSVYWDFVPSRVRPAASIPSDSAKTDAAVGSSQ